MPVFVLSFRIQNIALQLFFSKMGKRTYEQVSENESTDQESDTVSMKNDSNEHVSVFRPATREEMVVLEETTQLFKSNLFRLQMNELLESIQVKKLKSSEEALFEIKELLENIESIKPTDLEAAVALLKVDGIEIPFPHPGPRNVKYSFAFEPPAKIAVVGSYLLKSLVKGQANIDLAVEMPESLFQENDQKNHRYSYKRSFYLAVIARSLKRLGHPMYFMAHQNDTRRPILVLEPEKGILNTYFRIEN